MDRQSSSWSNGTFDTGRRSYTREVEGTIAIPHHLVLVTLSGGARHLEVDADCGHRYVGEDFANAVSFVPAGCGRRLAMRHVQAAWASISLRPDVISLAMAGAEDAGSLEIPTFTNARDPFVSSLMAEFVRLRAEGGDLDPGYCEAMTIALAHHLVRRYGRPSPARTRSEQRLPSWRLRRITEYVEANLGASIRVAELAGAVGLSAGHLHRAFLATTGSTPLEFINERRIERARQILASEATGIVELSARVGFSSPSHFSRIFQRITGVSPSEYRRGAGRR